MNTYPNFVPPGSGANNFNEYPFAKITSHLGVDDYMKWDPSKAPESFYHPYYLHNINDGLLTLRDAATAASIEMGIGKHLVDVVQYANGTNLGLAKSRVGVSYIKYLTTQNIIVNSGLAIKELTTDILTIASGYFGNFGVGNITISNPSISFIVGGSSYIDSITDANGRWSFSYGNIKTRDNIHLFNNSFNMFSAGSGSISTLGNVSFTNSLYTSDLLVTRGLVSGLFDTYQTNGKLDTNLITYSDQGHTHDASGFSKSILDHEIIGNIIFDGRYYYAVGTFSILAMDSTISNSSWHTLTSSRTKYTTDDRVFKNSSTGPILIRSLIYKGTPVFRGAILNNLNITAILGQHILRVSDGREYNLPVSVNYSDEMYLIDNNIYYVQSNEKQFYIHRFNGKVWKLWNYTLSGSLVRTCVSNNEIFIAHQSNTSKLNITRFSTIGIFKAIGSFPSFGTFNKISILDHDMVCLFNDSSSASVYMYNLNNTNYNQKLFEGLSISSSLSIYNDLNYIYVHVNSNRKKVLRNRSTSLTLDSIGGLYDAIGNISIKGSLVTKSIVTALCTDSLFSEMPSIYKDKFLLEPGRLSSDPIYSYTGLFNESYINRYLYLRTVTESPIYNDLTSSILYNNTYHIGHRGGMTSFTKNVNGMFDSSVSPSFPELIVAKLLPLNNFLYALVQDFKSALVDFVSDIPISPLASDNGTNLIPFVPTHWSVPFTKLYRTPVNKNSWEEDKNFTQLFGRNIIDASVYDNNLYVLAHNSNGSGIVSYRYSITDISISGVQLGYSGVLPLNESFITTPGIILSGFIQKQDGSFITTTGTYNQQAISDLNGCHEFYMYNHSFGPYVVHDQVEVLYNDIQPSSIYPYSGDTYYLLNPGVRYNYRTLSVSFLKNSLSITNPEATITSVVNNNIDTNIIKIPIMKDNPAAITDILNSDKYQMKIIADSTYSNRSLVHFITSVSFNKYIYLIAQVDQTINIYCIRDFGVHETKIPIAHTSETNYDIVRNATTIFGRGLSYTGIPVGDNYLLTDPTHANYMYLDFIATDVANTLMAKIDLISILGNKGSMYVLGDNDDLYIQKPKSKNYRYNKRYTTTSSMNIGSNLYLPITVRTNNPFGELYTFILGFFADGSVGIVDNNNVPSEMIYRPMGRSQIIYNNGRYMMASMKMGDDQPLNISYADLKASSTWNQLIDTIPSQYDNMYNMIALKQWVIAEYDIKITDNLNVRETL